MACPNCGDYRDDGLCPRCQADGYEDHGCGCVTAPDGHLLPCDRHHACDSGRVDACRGLATEQVGGLWLCAPCAAYERNQEPTDDQTMNAAGVEGGVRYDRTWEQR